MILYFSGTGNSEYVAKRIGSLINDEAVSLFERIRNRDFSEIYSGRPWVLVLPTYAWRIPRVIREWLEKTPMTGTRDIYFVMTCGDGIGGAEKYLKKLCNAEGLNYKGCMPIVMPENYILMFSAPAREEALEIIRAAEPVIAQAAQLIESEGLAPPVSVTVTDRLKSGIVNDFFYPMCVHARKFYAAKTCTSCGKCANLCPLKNIRLEQGRPVWGRHCTHCMACICSCPTGAIEYGSHSKGKIRYLCPKDTGTF